MKEKIHVVLVDLLENHESRAGKFFGHILLWLIALSTLSFALEHTAFFSQWISYFERFDQFVIGFFLVEYVLRFSVAPRKFKFILSPLGLVDLLVIISGISHFNIGFLRGMRLLRILQMLKVLRYSDFLLSFLRSFVHYKHEFRILGSSFIVVWLMSGLGAYLLEFSFNPKILSLTDALWWSLVTMATVGYGDVVPVTLSGKALAGVVIILGVATMAVLTAIVTRIFFDHFFGKREHTCEFCHYPHHDHDSKFCKNCGNPLDIKKLMQAVTVGPHHSAAKAKEAVTVKK